ncbi:MAG: hypothetical protein GXZ15_06025 [Campylobacter sp.]|nr:hypothetical protein [Campylobacter sp.]
MQDEILSSGSVGGSDGIKEIKLKAYIGLGCSIGLGCCILLGAFKIGAIFALLGLVFLLLAVVLIKKASNSRVLLSFFVMSVVILILGVGIIGLGGATSHAAFEISSMTMLAIAIGLVLLVVSSYFHYRFYKELYYVTDEKIFIFAFIIRIIGLFTLLVGLVLAIVSFAITGNILLIVAFILEILGWMRFKEIRQSKTA